jgi:hypothetical protein
MSEEQVSNLYLSFISVSYSPLPNFDPHQRRVRLLGLSQSKNTVIQSSRSSTYREIYGIPFQGRIEKVNLSATASQSRPSGKKNILI